MAIIELKGEWAYGVNFPSLDWRWWWWGSEIAIGVHRDSGKILAKTGSRAQVGICGFLRNRLLSKPKTRGFHRRIAISWISNKSPRDAASSFSVEVRAWFRYGNGVKGSVSRITFWKHGGGGPHICEEWQFRGGIPGGPTERRKKIKTVG